MDTPASGPLAGARLSYVFLVAEDLDVLLPFYRDTLGLPLIFQQPGTCAFLRLGGGPQLSLYSRASVGAEPDEGRSRWDVTLPGIGWDVPDLDAARSALLEAGVEVSDIVPVPAGRAAMFRDPEGNQLEIHQPA